MKFSKDYVMFCHITTQIQGEKYGELLDEKGGPGWPYFVFMDAEGAVLAVHQEEPEPASFARTGGKAKTYAGLREKAAKGDKPAQIDLLLAQMEMGMLSIADGQKKFKELGTASKDQEAKLAAMVLDASIIATAEAIEDEKAEKAVGKSFYEQYTTGKPGPTGDRAMQPYYILIMGAAEEAKDIKTFEAALKILKGKFESNPRAKSFFEEKEKALEKLKAEKK